MSCDGYWSILFTRRCVQNFMGNLLTCLTFSKSLPLISEILTLKLLLKAEKLLSMVCVQLPTAQQHSSCSRYLDKQIKCLMKYAICNV